MIHKKLFFEFAPTGGGDVTGKNDPVIQPFKGYFSYSLARESIQNVLDAKIPISNKPAVIDFSKISRKASQIPGLDQLNEYLKLLAFVNQWLSDGLYVVVALIWLVPDRRIESRVNG